MVSSASPQTGQERRLHRPEGSGQFRQPQRPTAAPRVKRTTNHASIPPVPIKAKSLLSRRTLRQDTTKPAATFVLRSDRRSWFSVAITGFGAVLLQYLKTVRERARTVRNR